MDCDQRWRQRMGGDNVTAIVVRFGPVAAQFCQDQTQAQACTRDED